MFDLNHITFVSTEHTSSLIKHVAVNSQHHIWNWLRVHFGPCTGGTQNCCLKVPHLDTPALSVSIECGMNITKNTTSYSTRKHSQENEASKQKNLQTQPPPGSTPTVLLLLKMHAVTKILPPFDKCMSAWKIKRDLCWVLPVNAAHTDYTENHKPLREITHKHLFAHMHKYRTAKKKYS